MRAADAGVHGDKAGVLELADDLMLNADGKSEIGYADYAIGIADEIVTDHPHIRERISLVSK